jgi:hypothetical protein
MGSADLARGSAFLRAPRFAAHRLSKMMYAMKSKANDPARYRMNKPAVLIFNQSCVADLSHLSKIRLAMTSWGALFIQRSGFNR